MAERSEDGIPEFRHGKAATLWSPVFVVENAVLVSWDTHRGRYAGVRGPHLRGPLRRHPPCGPVPTADWRFEFGFVRVRGDRTPTLQLWIARRG